MVGTRGKPGDKEDSVEREGTSKELTGTELAEIQAKLRQKEIDLAENQNRIKTKEAQLKARENSLREEAGFLTEQRKKQDKRSREIELLQERMQRESVAQAQGVAPEEIDDLRKDYLGQIEELRREISRLRRDDSPSIRLSGQPLLSLDESAGRAEPPPPNPLIILKSRSAKRPSPCQISMGTTYP